MNKSLTVLVSGATGNQGGAVAEALLAKGHKVRALTRNKSSDAAKRLAAKGAELIRCNFDYPESLKRLLKGVDTFYLMGTPFESGVRHETAQGIALANAADAANVGHLIYGSVANADRNTGIPHFDSKYKVEQHIKTLNINYTISAPVYFMDNLTAPWSIDALIAGQISAALPGSRMLQQVSVRNIGQFVAGLVERRESVFGKRFDIAGDELTGSTMARIIRQVTKHEVVYESFPLSILKEQSEDMAAMYEWFDKVGYNVDIRALHKTFSDVDWQNYRQWVESQEWGFLKGRKAA